MKLAVYKIYDWKVASLTTSTRKTCMRDHISNGDEDQEDHQIMSG